ncbi:MAG TPA: hypothetical protein VGE08_15025 [Steroidobacter sp.]|uniref:hypothetical protein n=1 Tax=Steroidobacter sp. TaxID=1978227 RepID=UPI002EDA10E8
MIAKARLTTLLLWLVVGGVAALSGALTRPAAHIGEEYFPFGNDGFYHAVRILDAVKDPSAFYEFDPKIHAPEGSLLVWPWGYDYAMARIVRAASNLGIGDDPLMILLWIPVAATLIGAGLTMLVARAAGLGTWATVLAGLCMALGPSTQLTYGFGKIDHHYVEHIFVLASLAAGLRWFRSPSSASGAVLGSIFGVALAVHNALFVLLLPFLGTALLLWLQGKQSPLRPSVAFAAALVLTTLAVLLPSEPFRQGRFEFYLLSWFHLYIVSCAGLVTVLLSRLAPTRRNMGLMILIATALLAPLIGQIIHARSFVNGTLGMLDQIQEMRSPLQVLSQDGIRMLSMFYTVLVLAAPLAFAFCVLRAWRERTSPRLLFWAWCVFGLALMATQIRMHYFGTFALYLPWLVLVQEWAERWPEHAKRTLLLASLALVLAYAPTIRLQLVAPAPKSGDPWFAALHPMFKPLREHCSKDPGVVLADTNAGHYIRYFSDCSVIANNFLLTAQQFDKADEALRLLSLPAEQLPAEAPYVKYVLVRPVKLTVTEAGNFRYGVYGGDLAKTLLLTAPGSVPPQYQLLFTVKLPMRMPGSDQVRMATYAKLYKVIRPEATSANDVSE